MFVEGMIFGNTTVAEATSLVDLIASRIKGADLEADLRHTNRLVSLPYGTEIRYVTTPRLLTLRLLQQYRQRRCVGRL
jgi:hypothetical protein